MYEDERSTPQERGAFASRTLDDGRIIDVTPLMWDAASLGVILPEDRNLSLYSDVWHYASASAAVAAMEEYDGTKEPHGWTRHPASGRRRPDADPAQEHVRE